MSEILQNFSINLPGLIAQVVNFLIVFGILWFFALKPVKTIMDERTTKIEKSLKDAEKIEKDLIIAGERREAELKKVKKEASVILQEANNIAAKNKKEILLTAQAEVGKEKNKAKIEIQDAKKQMLQDVKTEITNLVIATVKKIVNKDLSDDEHKTLIAQTIKETEDENK